MEIEKETEMIEAGEEMEIQLLGDAVQLPDLMIIGSHCVGMDFPLARCVNSVTSPDSSLWAVWEEFLLHVGRV